MPIFPSSFWGLLREQLFLRAQFPVALREKQMNLQPGAFYRIRLRQVKGQRSKSGLRSM